MLHYQKSINNCLDEYMVNWLGLDQCFWHLDTDHSAKVPSSNSCTVGGVVWCCHWSTYTYMLSFELAACKSANINLFSSWSCCKLHHEISTSKIIVSGTIISTSWDIYLSQPSNFFCVLFFLQVFWVVGPVLSRGPFSFCIWMFQTSRFHNWSWTSCHLSIRSHWNFFDNANNEYLWWFSRLIDQ